ncbi:MULTISPECIES: hypothetical protein [unclassified Peribacillus]|uniref:hypothetical protein n=1 Tax=unclassified Peribacillus TaxID=2675266 RepID=UPI00366D30AA
MDKNNTNYESYLHPYQRNFVRQQLDIGGLWLTDDGGRLQFTYYDDSGNFSPTPTNNVEGYYRDPSMSQSDIGKIVGKLSAGNRLIGTWTRSTSQSQSSGGIYLDFYENGKKFMGKWGYGSEVPQHPYSGHR